MTETYVIVHRSYDPVQADLLGDILRDNGIAARVLGTRHGAVIGVGQNILQLHIEVPQSQAGEATDFLESYFDSDGAELLREHGIVADDDDERESDGRHNAGDDDDEQSAYESPRRPFFAAGLSFIMGFMGGGHLYGRRPWTALVLTAGQIGAVTLMLSREWSIVATGVALCAALLLSDLVGSQRAVRSFNRGERMPMGRQLITGILLVTISGALSAFVGPRIPEPDKPDMYDTASPRSGVAAPAR